MEAKIRRLRSEGYLGSLISVLRRNDGFYTAFINDRVVGKTLLENHNEGRAREIAKKRVDNEIASLAESIRLIQTAKTMLEQGLRSDPSMKELTARMNKWLDQVFE